MILAMMLNVIRMTRRGSLSTSISEGICEMMPPMIEIARNSAIWEIDRPTALANRGPTDSKMAVDKPTTATPKEANNEIRNAAKGYRSGKAGSRDCVSATGRIDKHMMMAMML